MNLIKYAGMLLDKNPKLCYKLVLAKKVFANDQVDEFIKQIGVNKKDPKVEKIREIKNKKILYPKDESLIKLLWWQAKQESLQDKLGRYKVEIGKGQETLLDQVVERLNKKVLDALRDYNKFPKE